MTSVNSRRPSAWWRHCSNTFFHDNFVIFRHRSKRIAFLNQWIFLRVSTCKLSFFVIVTWPFFGTLHGPAVYIWQIPGHRLSRLAKSNLQNLGFPPVPLFWGLAYVQKNAVFWIWLRPHYIIPECFTIAPVLTYTLTVCRRNRGDLLSLYRLRCVTSNRKT